MKRFLALVLFLLGLLLVPIGAQAKHDPKQTTTNYGHGSGLQPLTAGGPSWNESWWWGVDGPNQRVNVSGYTTDSGMAVVETGKVTIRDAVTGIDYGPPQQTCNSCNLDIDGTAAVVPGRSYTLTWQATATLTTPGWTWGSPTDPTVCTVQPGALTMSCIYTTGPFILLPAFATPTPQPPTPTPTPGLQPTATPTPEFGNASCSLSSIGSAGNVLQTFLLVVYSDTDANITIGAFSLFIHAIPLNGLPQTVFPPINFPAAGTTKKTFTVRYGPLTTATRYLISYEVGVETRQGEAQCGTTVVLQVAA